MRFRKCYTIHFERYSVVLYGQTFLRDILVLLYEYILREIPLYCMDIFFEREKMEYLL